MGKAGATENFPMKGEMVWMKVSGKVFAMTNVKPLTMDGQMVSPFHLVNLKCDPARALMLREEFDDIRPAWHQNKTHWNTLLMGGVVPDALIKQLIDHSYDLVAASLTKAQRRALS